MLCSKCSEEVKPIVALDIDGVLGLYHEHLLTFMDAYFGREMPRGWDGAGDWEMFLGLSRHDYRDAKLAFRQGGMKRTMPVSAGAFNIAFKAKAHGAELWITTTRPYNRLDSVDPDTREWLHRNHIDYDHLLYDEHKYDRLALIVDPARVVFVLDDLPEMVAEANRNFKGRGHLLERPHNQHGRNNRTSTSLSAVPNLVVAQDIMIDNIKNWSTT